MDRIGVVERDPSLNSRYGWSRIRLGRARPGGRCHSIPVAVTKPGMYVWLFCNIIFCKYGFMHLYKYYLFY
jgi:hypothetical protein